MISRASPAPCGATRACAGRPISPPSSRPSRRAGLSAAPPDPYFLCTTIARTICSLPTTLADVAAPAFDAVMCNEFRFERALDDLLAELAQLQLPLTWEGGAPN